MIGIIATRTRLLAKLMKRSSLDVIETIEDFQAYRGHVPHANDSGTSECVMLMSGTGRDRTAKAAEWMLQEFAPRLIISAAYSESTNEDSAPGEIIIASRCVALNGNPVEWRENESSCVDLNGRTLSVARRAVEAGGVDYQIGTVVTIHRNVRTIGMKRWLNSSFQAQAIDQESTHIAQACEGYPGVDLLIVRCPIDAGGLESRFLGERIGAGPSANMLIPATLYFASHPFQFSELRQLARNSGLGRDAITAFIPMFLQEWGKRL